MLSINKSLICIALPLATLTACGGGGGSAEKSATAPAPAVPKASISTSNAQELGQAVLANGSLAASSVSILDQFNAFSPKAQARNSATSGSENCQQAGSLDYRAIGETGLAVNFHGCEMDMNLFMDGGFEFIAANLSTAPLINITYKNLHIKMVDDTDSVQDLNDTINGTFSMTYESSAQTNFTTTQNLVRTDNETGVTVQSKQVNVSYGSNGLMPTAASGTVNHSLYGDVTLAMQDTALLIKGEASTLKVELQGPNYVLSIDEDNDGTFEQQSSPTQLAGEALVWNAI